MATAELSSLGAHLFSEEEYTNTVPLNVYSAPLAGLFGGEKIAILRY
jgi:hypothetical protein